MRTYLSSSRLFRYIRRKFGIKKPYALELGRWEKWKEKTQRDHPLGYFLTETLPDLLDAIWKAITDPYYNTRYYIRNRFIRKTHVLRTDCKPGEYMDTDEKIVTALANAVIDFVEIELAYKSLWCGTEESKAAVWKNGRCPELGLAHLAWEMTLDDPNLDVTDRCDSQAAHAREVHAIYAWAKTRNDRIDPHTAGGWMAYCDKYPDTLWEEKTAEQEEEADAALKKVREIEEQYDQEDRDMMIRLIKVRKSMWT